MPLKNKKVITYLVILSLAILVSMKASISYALLNIFISEENLPLELGVANKLGEQGAQIVNMIIDTVIWFSFFTLNYYIYKRLKILKTIMFLILSPILWIAGTYIWVLMEIFIFHSFRLNLFSGCSGTGFPFMREVCFDNALFAFYYLTIFFWFLVIWFIWEKLIIQFSHFLYKHVHSRNRI